MRVLRFLIAFCVISTAMLAADSPFVGTWKLNVAKSKFVPGTEIKEGTMTFEAVGGKMRRVFTGVDADGQKINDDAAIAWDGKPHKIEEPPGTTIIVTVKNVNAQTVDATVTTTDGKLVNTVKAVVAKDGKSMKVTEKGEDEKGRKVDSSEVFERQ